MWLSGWQQNMQNLDLQVTIENEEKIIVEFFVLTRVRILQILLNSVQPQPVGTCASSVIQKNTRFMSRLLNSSYFMKPYINAQVLTGLVS
jgi:hypothetical protein